MSNNIWEKNVTYLDKSDELLVLDLDSITIKKLIENGFSDLMDIAVTFPSHLAETCSIPEDKAAEIITLSRQNADVGNFLTGVEIQGRERSKEFLTTSSKAMDELLNGGIRTKTITELYGLPKSGKTLIALQCAINCTKPRDQGGLDGDVMIIDTEGKFDLGKIVEIGNSCQLDTDQILKRIHLARAYSTHEQMLLINKARYKARDCNVKLLIVDSVINLFKKEYIGLRNLVDRQQKLHIHIRDLMKFADRHNSSIFITNHYVNGKPAGGQNLAHSASYRLYIRKSRGRRNENRRIIRLVDSPNLPEAEVIIKITGEGLSDT